MKTNKVITKGFYSIIRHPQYLGWAILSFSLILIRQHIIITLLGLIIIVLFYTATKEEEKALLNKFGEDYQSYMIHVPRWNIIRGFVRRFFTKQDFN